MGTSVHVTDEYPAVKQIFWLKLLLVQWYLSQSALPTNIVGVGAAVAVAAAVGLAGSGEPPPGPPPAGGGGLFILPLFGLVPITTPIMSVNQ